MTTLITNGTVISPSGAVDMDVLIDGEQIVALVQPGSSALGSDLASTAERVIDARGKYVIPGGVDAHTHMELPFGGTFASDTFETGTRAAAWGGTTTIIDFAVQRAGERVFDGLEAWHGKADGNCAIDYGFHMIVGGVDDDSLAAMDKLVNEEGITSVKLFMAYPGVFLSDDAQILKAMQKASSNGSMIMMHAENGPAIDVLIAQALARGNVDPIYHGITRPVALEEEATHRAIKLAEVAGAPVYIVHMSAREAVEQVVAARDRGRERVRRDLPAVPLPEPRRSPRRAGVRRREVRLLHSPALEARAPPGGLVAVPAAERPSGRVDRPLPLLLQGAEGARHRRLLEDPERDRRCRAPHGPALPGCRRRRDHRRALGRRRGDDPGSHVRPLPPQGHHRPRRRRRCRDLRPSRRRRC